MAAEAGHAPNRVYTDQSGDFHTNNASFFNDDENDIAAQLNVLDTLVAAELTFIDGALAGTPVASKVLVMDANLESNSIGVIKSVDKLIATAAVLTLGASPVTVLAAVGSGVYAQFLGAYVFLDYNSVAYVDETGEDLVFQHLSGGAVVSQTLDGAEFDGTADALVVASPNNDDASETNTLVDNGGFEVTLATGEWVTGNSPLKIRLFYRELRKASLEAIA